MLRALVLLLIAVVIPGCSDDNDGLDEQVLRDANAGDPKAQFTLGNLYRAKPRDHEKAVTWYRKAADQGHAGAQGALGSMYNEGRGVDMDTEAARAWWRKAADRGNAGAQCNLGVSYQHDIVAGVGEGAARSGEEAVSWLRKAADQGLAEAQLNLGVWLRDGQGIARDHVRAYAWFHVIAEREDQPAPDPNSRIAFGGNSLASLYAGPGSARIAFAQAPQLRDAVARSMTQEQIAEARKLSREFTAKIEANQSRARDN